MLQLPVEFVARMKRLMDEEEFRLYEASYQENAVRAFRVNTEKISVEDFAGVDPFSSGKHSFSACSVCFSHHEIRCFCNIIQ